MKPSAPGSNTLPNAARILGDLAITALAWASASAIAANLPPQPQTPVLVAQAALPANLAQAGARPAAGATPVTASTAVAAEAKPLWKDLTPAQQQSLKPLAANWSGINEGQKRKWIALSKNFPAKSPAEQAKLHSRMTEWVSLSQQQRTQARLNFAETKTLSPSEKSAQWKAYQALSPEEKQKLAAKGGPVPAGATNAIKPVPEQRLAKVPATRRTQPAGTVAAHHPKVDANTLLPLAPGANTSSDAATAPKN